MLTVHPADTTLFSSNGLAVLRPVEASVTEAVNGEFALYLRHPIDAAGRWQHLNEDNIIIASTPGGPQPFRIYRINKLLSGEIEVDARHISYDLLGNLILNSAPTDTTATDALVRALDETPFSGWSDVTGNQSARWVRKNALAAVMGEDENSIINRWGGEVERDGYALNIRQRLGADRGVTVRYRKNLTGLECTADISGVITRILPTGLKEDGQTVLELPEVYIDSPLISTYANVITAHMHYGDIQVGDPDEGGLTEPEALDALRAAAAAEFAAGRDLPEMGMRVNFVDLAQTVEYKDISMLERVYLGDTVHVFHEGLGVDVAMRVVAYTYDAIAERYTEVQLGTPMRNIVAAINSQAARQLTFEQRQSDLAAATLAATAQLASPGDSYIRLVPNVSAPAEIYAMDAEAPEEAVNVIRINAAGIGVSVTGINGPYITAMTGAGINATAITTGVLGAELIFAGVLEAARGTFTRLVAGVADAQRLQFGVDDADEPYASVYGPDGVERTSMRLDGFRLLDGGVRMVPYEIGTRKGLGIFVE